VRRAFKFVFGALVIVVVGVGAFVAWYVFADRAPGRPELSNTQTSSAGPTTTNGRWTVLAEPQSFVGYRIKELFGDAVLKRDAVGRTNALTGTLTIAGGRVTAAVVTANLSKLDSGREARDAYARDNALETSKFPTARFTLSAPIALPAPTVKGRRVHAQASGVLLLHGMTRPVTVTLDARWTGPTIDVVGTAPILLRDYGIKAPDTPIAKVDDHGSFELDLEFVPG